MKKLTKILVLAIVLMSIGFIGCKKQQITNINGNSERDTNFSFSVSNKMLSFPSVEDYQKAIDFLCSIENDNFNKWDKLTGFKSLRLEKEKNKNIKFSIEDQVFTSLLNEKGKIQIQGKIFQINPKDSTVAVFDENMKKINVFSFNDDVIGIVFDNQKVEKKKRCSSCNQFNPNYRSIQRGSQTIRYKVAYFRDGIYFTLVAKMKRPNPDVSYLMKISIPNGTCLYRCSLSIYKYKAQTKQTNGRKVKIRPYAKCYPLKQYDFSASFYINGETWESPFRIYCPY